VIADYFVITTARNPRQAMAIAREIEGSVKQGPLKESGLKLLNAAGMEGEGHWILLDLDLVVVHIFTAETRTLYDLENLWADAPRVPFTPRAPGPAAASRSL
jgi:ribosome-associated protein